MSRYCSLCQTIWTRGLPARDSSSITGLVLDKSFLSSLYIHGVILNRPRDRQHGDINMPLYGNPTAWYLFLATVPVNHSHLVRTPSSTRFETKSTNYPAPPLVFPGLSPRMPPPRPSCFILISSGPRLGSSRRHERKNVSLPED